MGRRGGGLAPRQLAVIRTFFVAGTVAKGLVGGCSPPRSPPPPRVVVCGEWPPPGAQGGGQGGGLTPRRPRGPHIIRHNISDSIHAGPFVLRHHPGIAVEVILAARRWAWWLFAVAEEWRVPGWPVAGGSSHVWPGTMVPCQWVHPGQMAEQSFLYCRPPEARWPVPALMASSGLVCLGPRGSLGGG